MHFAPIVPTSCLQRYLSGRKVWMALAQIDDPSYINFYRQAPDDVTVILDNGEYEGMFSVGEFVAAIAAMQPDVIILPDILGSWRESLHLSLGLYQLLREGPYECMFVPQGNSEDEIDRSLLEASCYPIEWIGMPRYWTTNIDPLLRVKKARELSGNTFTTHALGMADGNVHELHYLAQAGVHSCDSSAPVWRGMNSKTLHDPWTGPDIDFNAENDLSEPKGLVANSCVAYNLQEVDRACQTPQSSTS